jgi:integrase
VYRYAADGKKKSQIVGTLQQYPKRAQAEKAAEHLRMAANPDAPAAQLVTFGHVIDRYISEALPERFSTADSYKAWLNAYIKPKWGEYPIAQVQSGNVETWLKSLTLAPKSRRNIRDIMRRVFKCAMRWNLIPLSVNPMSLVEVEGGTKRLSKAPVLTVEQVKTFMAAIPLEPFRTMAWLAVGLGLERSTVVGLRWRDVDFEKQTVHVRTGIVNNREGDTKNEYRAAPLPLDPALAAMLQTWRLSTPFSEDKHWVFASPYRYGKQPYNPRHVAIDHFWPAAKAIGMDKLGWQSLRRTYASLLTAFGTGLKVTQSLMRHSDPKTTMALYADSYSADMQKANSAVVKGMIQ